MHELDWDNDEHLSLLFRRAPGLSAGAIAWWGNGYHGWSHVDAELFHGAILIGARDDRVKPPGWSTRIPSGVQWRPRNYQRVKYASRVIIPCTPAQRAAWEELEWAGIGDPYDQAAILGFAEGKPLHTSGSFICSAYQYNRLIHNQVGLLPPTIDRPAQQVTPDDLYLLAQGIWGARVEKVDPSELS